MVLLLRDTAMATVIPPSSPLKMEYFPLQTDFPSYPRYLYINPYLSSPPSPPPAAPTPAPPISAQAPPTPTFLPHTNSLTASANLTKTLSKIQPLPFDDELDDVGCRTPVLTALPHSPPMLPLYSPPRSITINGEKSEGYSSTPASCFPDPAPPWYLLVDHREPILRVSYGRAENTWIEEPPGSLFLESPIQWVYQRPTCFLEGVNLLPGRVILKAINCSYKCRLNRESEDDDGRGRYDVSDGFMLQRLYVAGYLIISAPYNVSFDDEQVIRETYEWLHACLGSILSTGVPENWNSAEEITDHPFYFVGHSNGALLQELKGSHFCEKHLSHDAPLVTVYNQVSYFCNGFDIYLVLVCVINDYLLMVPHPCCIFLNLIFYPIFWWIYWPVNVDLHTCTSVICIVRNYMTPTILHRINAEGGRLTVEHAHLKNFGWSLEIPCVCDCIKALVKCRGVPFLNEGNSNLVLGIFVSASLLTKMARYIMTGTMINSSETPDDNGMVRLKVLGLLQNGPAHSASIRQGDEILFINGVVVKGKLAIEASSVLRGPSETSFGIMVKQGDCGFTQSVKIQRQSIDRSSVFYCFALVKNDPSFVGYVHLKEFNALAKKELVTTKRRPQDKGASYFVWDLRDNLGGLVQAGIEIAKFFLNKRDTVTYTVGWDPLIMKNIVVEGSQVIFATALAVKLLSHFVVKETSLLITLVTSLYGAWAIFSSMLLHSIGWRLFLRKCGEYILPCSISTRTQVIHDIIQCYSSGRGTITFAETKDSASTLVGLFPRACTLHGDIQQPTSECEPPRYVEAYIQCSGRTRRGGKNGVAVMLYDHRKSNLSGIERESCVKFARISVPQPADIAKSVGVVAAKKIKEISDSVTLAFKAAAEELLTSSDLTSADILAKALAKTTGYTEIKTQSLLTSLENHATVLLECGRYISSPSFVYGVLQRAGKCCWYELRSGEIVATFARNSHIKRKIWRWQWQPCLKSLAQYFVSLFLQEPKGHHHLEDKVNFEGYGNDTTSDVDVESDPNQPKSKEVVGSTQLEKKKKYQPSQPNSGSISSCS